MSQGTLDPEEGMMNRIAGRNMKAGFKGGLETETRGNNSPTTRRFD